MGGAVAGTIIKHFTERSARCIYLAVTVNNQCNLHCPHCYLQYQAKSYFLPREYQEKIVGSSVNHVAIAGMEPFMDRATAAQTINFAKKLGNSGKTVSVITNGFGLNFLDQDDAALFSAIDVSFDGGESSYESFRGASYNKLINILSRFKHKNISALHTVCRENIDFIDDMMSIWHDYEFSQIMFSPFIRTESEGLISTNEVRLHEILDSLSVSQSYLSNPNAFLLVDEYHVMRSVLDRLYLDRLPSERRSHYKIVRVPNTPLATGGLRVTYDGKILSPYTALQTAWYRKDNRYHLNNDLLDDVFVKLLGEEKAAVRHMA